MCVCERERERGVSVKVRLKERQQRRRLSTGFQCDAAYALHPQADALDEIVPQVVLGVAGQSDCTLEVALGSLADGEQLLDEEGDGWDALGGHLLAGTEELLLDALNHASKGVGNLDHVGVVVFGVVGGGVGGVGPLRFGEGRGSV